MGAWIAAGFAARVAAELLRRTMAVLLVVLAVALLFGQSWASGAALLGGPVQVAAGVIAGCGIGVLAALLGVAGGELLIPTLVLLFGVDMKRAGSLSFVICSHRSRPEETRCRNWLAGVAPRGHTYHSRLLGDLIGAEYGQADDPCARCARHAGLVSGYRVRGASDRRKRG